MPCPTCHLRLGPMPPRSIGDCGIAVQTNYTTCTAEAKAKAGPRSPSCDSSIGQVRPDHPADLAPAQRREDTGFVRLDTVVASLMERANRARAEREEEAGAAANDDLVSAECRPRQAERRL